MTGVESSGFERSMCMSGDIPEMLAALRLLDHDVEGPRGRGDSSRRHGCAENQGTGVVLEEVDDRVVTGNEASK